MGSEAPSVHIVSLGCARNLSDAEVALGLLVKEGFRYSAQLEGSDIAVVNTCAFIEDAKEESLEAVMETLELKRRGKVGRVAVTGCLSQRYAAELWKEIPEADAVVGIDELKDLPSVLKRLSAKGGRELSVARAVRFLPTASMPRERLSAPHSIYVKISEGCVNRCAYCAIPGFRGAHRSRTVNDILKEVTAAAEGGLLREVNLIGQNTAAFGFDRCRKPRLSDLLNVLAPAVPGVWIRVLYMHPAHVRPELIRSFRNHANVCAYADLPIEHSHPAVLRRMRRGCARSTIERVIRDFRLQVPGIALRSAVIVGLPGETREEFEDLLRFIGHVRFARLGAFKYSREEGTSAAKMKPQITKRTKESRFVRVMELQRSVSARWGKTQIGKKLRVLVEGRTQDGRFVGRSVYDAPDVDGRIFIKPASGISVGEFADVMIRKSGDYDLYAD